ncbi:hypothetical protein MIJ3_00416 [Pseudomonas phage vB_PaeM_MIJ3]|nr:hypothetical protein MIJ3_00416 [Pseudomonas phage vB_PaeM_MIJ3]
MLSLTYFFVEASLSATGCPKLIILGFCGNFSERIGL